MAAPQASSRLELLQARFQQKQLQEKEQKLLQLYDQQQQRAYQVVQRGSAGSNGSTTSNHGTSISHHTVTRTSSSSHATSTSQGGKVRQMFDERRQTTVKGIDRSYPLEPLENKPRKQQPANGVSTQRNGNFTVTRQSVTVKRAARADVNSNLNAGKPVLSYHEEVTRESFDSPGQHYEDKDEFGIENHLAPYINGNHREDTREVQIEEVLDEDTIERNRMMAKLHLMEYDESMKHRRRNDLESEQFPEDLLVDVPDRLPKRTATKKLSQAEARLERFRNANAKRTTLSKGTTPTTTVSKKRSEPTFPTTKPTSRTYEGASNARIVSKSSSPSASWRKNSFRSPLKGSKRSSGKFDDSIGNKEFADRPKYFCVESEKSATTYGARPISSGDSSRQKILRPKRDTNQDWEYIPENLKPFLSRDPPTKSLPEKSKASGLTSAFSGNQNNIKSAKRGTGSPSFFHGGTEKSETTIGLKPRLPQSPLPEVTALGTKSMEQKLSRKNSETSSLAKSDSTLKYFSRSGSETSTTNASLMDQEFQSSFDSGKIIGKHSDYSRSPSPSLLTLSERVKTREKRSEHSPEFIRLESDKSTTTITVVPETIRKVKPGGLLMERRAERKAKDIRKFGDCPRTTLSLRDLDSKNQRSTIGSKNIRSRSLSPGKLMGRRVGNQELVSREAKKYGTIRNVKQRVNNNSVENRLKNSRSFQQRLANDYTVNSRKSTINSIDNRKSGSLGNSTSPGTKSDSSSRRGSGHVLRSITLIRDVINRQQRQQTQRNTVAKQAPLKLNRSATSSEGSKTSECSTRTITRGFGRRSFTPVEVDAEIQEITLSHRYMERDKLQDTGGMESSNSRQKSFEGSCSVKSGGRFLLEDSSGKSCKKREGTPLNDSNSHLDRMPKTKMEAHRGSFEDSRSGRAVSLKQIMQNKSDNERSTSNNPSPNSGKKSKGGLVDREGIAKGTRRSQKQTYTSTTSNSPRTFASKEKWPGDISKSPERPLREKGPEIDAGEILRSTDLVRRIMKVDTTTGRNKTANAKSGKFGNSEEGVIKGGNFLERRKIRVEGSHGVTHGRETKLTAKTRSRARSLEKPDPEGKRILKKGVESKRTTPKTEDFHGEQHKVVKKDKAVYSGWNDEKSRIQPAANNPYPPRSRIKSATDADDKLSDAKEDFWETSRSEQRSMVHAGKVSGMADKNPSEHRINEAAWKFEKAHDYSRTDSEESALRRFDSIGAESVERSISTSPDLHCKRDLNNETLLKQESGMNRVKTANSKEAKQDAKKKETHKEGVTISLKTLDQKQRVFSGERGASPRLLSKKGPTLAVKELRSKASFAINMDETPKFEQSRSRKKFARARDSMEIVRLSIKSKSPACKRRLFQDTESQTPKLIRTSGITTNILSRKKAPSFKLNDQHKSNEVSENSDSSISKQQLRSIEDIRRSILPPIPKSAMAKRFERESRAKVAAKKIAEIRNVLCKDENNFSRMTKSPSPEPAPRKLAESGRTSSSSGNRRSVPASPSKSPEESGRIQESKSTRRPAKVTESSVGKRTTVNAKKSIDLVDGNPLGNGLHSEENTTDPKQEDHLSKKADAFVIEFDMRPAKDPHTKKPPLSRKQSGEKLGFSAQPTRPASSISSASSGSSHSQGSSGKSRMAAKAKSSLSGTSPSKGASSAKSGITNSVTDNLVPCKTCGRRFAQDRVTLHEQICTKTAQKKRKQFDTTLYRVRGTELEPFVKKGLTKKQPESKPKKSEPKSNWRRKHEDFINAIRSAKQVQAHLAAGGKLSDLPPPPPSDTSDYIQCPHCGRKFNQAAAERHIPKCEHMLHNKPTHSRGPKPRR